MGGVTQEQLSSLLPWPGPMEIPNPISSFIKDNWIKGVCCEC